jgi:hypothetical protein
MLRDRELDLVIKSEEDMKLLLHYLVLKLRTVDGIRDSGMPQVRLMALATLKGQIKANFASVDQEAAFIHELEASNQDDIQEIYEAEMRRLSLNVCARFMMLRIRMKISYEAFTKNMTVAQLFYRTILRTYETFKRQGLIPNPWPEPDTAFIRLILMLQNDRQDREVQGKYIRKQVAESGERFEDFDVIRPRNSIALGGLTRALNENYIRQRKRTMAAVALNGDRVAEIFKGVFLKMGNVDYKDKAWLGNEIKFKFKRALLLNAIARLNLMDKLGAPSLPILILMRLKRTEFVRQLFCLQLMKGVEVKIPESLLLANRPKSFQFYDPLIRMARQQVLR